LRRIGSRLIHFAIAALTIGSIPNQAQAFAQHADLVLALKQFVVTLGQPVLTYSWSSADYLEPFWRTHFAADAPAGRAHVLSMGQLYFQGMCSGDRSIDPDECGSAPLAYGRRNQLGPGLYLATDPVSSISYGGDDGNWILTQVELPRGLRVADLTWPIKDDTLSPAAISDLAQIGNCVSSAMTASDAIAQLTQVGRQNSICSLNARQFLKDELKIQAVYYEYQEQPFTFCSAAFPFGFDGESRTGNDIRQGAFVLADASGLDSGAVKIFNADSTDESHLRREIVSAFYEALPSQLKALNSYDYYQKHSPADYPDVFADLDLGYQCETQSGKRVCGNRFSFTNPKTGSGPTLILPDISSSPLKTRNIKRISAKAWPSDGIPNGALWKDLEGLELDSDVNVWIHTNLLGCQAQAPFFSTK